MENPEPPANPGVPLPPPIRPQVSAVALPPPLTAETEPPPPGPWGFWPTAGWTALILVAALAAEIVVTIAFIIVLSVAKQRPVTSPETLFSSGLLLGVATLLTSPIMVALAVAFARMRKGIQLKDYLGLNWPAKRTVGWWLAAFIILIVSMDVITTLLHRPIVPDFMVQAYRTAYSLPLLLMGVCVAAPVAEEFLFRGFFMTGLRHSNVGAPGAVLLSALAWAGIHLQYDLYGMAMIFVGGIFLGITRLRTGSVWLCVALHALMNTYSSIELLIKVASEKA